MNSTADVVVIGAGIQGASLAFHLARRGVRVVVVERGVVAGGATGRSSGNVRMHYDLEGEARLAWASYPYFRDWSEWVGVGTCDFVRTGFVQLVPPEQADLLRANVEMQRGLGIETELVDADDVARLLPGIRTDDVVAAAYEPGSGYADPTAATTGFLAAARQHGARYLGRTVVRAVRIEGDRVAGIDADTGRIDAPIVVDVAGAWAAEVARTAGVEIPVQAWRHPTAFFGIPAEGTAGFPVVIDGPSEAYFRPEGRDLMLVGLETGNAVGGEPDRPLDPPDQATIEAMIDAVCARLPWMAAGTLRATHGGQDGISEDQHAIIGPAGPDGFYLDCGHSGTGFKTAPAVGAALAELILDGRSSTADLAPFDPGRFAAGRPLVGAHPYPPIWR
jgi:sarcosine oxidase subunit beta